jgi:hypothetical protein
MTLRLSRSGSAAGVPDQRVDGNVTIDDFEEFLHVVLLCPDRSEDYFTVLDLHLVVEFQAAFKPGHVAHVATGSREV